MFIISDTISKAFTYTSKVLIDGKRHKYNT